MKNYGKIQTDKDVTTKQYVDSKNGLTQDDTDNRYLKLSGGTLSGDLSIDGRNKRLNFIGKDDSGFNRIGWISNTNEHSSPDGENTAGGSPCLSVSTELSLEAHKITNLSTPEYTYDAANKKYVDDTVSSVSSTATSAQTKATEAMTKATSAETKATAAQNALANKQDKITGAANKLVGINSSGVAAVTDTFTINGPIQIGSVRIQYNTSTKSLDFLPIS